MLVLADKVLTYWNIKSVEKNFPQIDKFSIEKNPLAKWFFQKTGLFWGSVIYFFISLVMFYLAWVLLTTCLNLFRVTNSPTIALYVLVLWYFVVIGNNIFHLFRYTRIIP